MMSDNFINFPEPRFVQAGDVRFAVYETGPKDGKPILLLHGWPELAYSWKLILPALAAAGYRAIAIDQKGFGNSDCPDEVRAYAMDVLTADFAALIDALGYEKMILCGHDWGGAMVWPMAYRYPTKVDGVISICTPHRQRAPAPPIEIFRQQAGDKHYIVEFQDEDLPDRVFGGGRELKFFEFVFQKSVPRNIWPKLLPQALFMPARFASFERTPEERLAVPRNELPVFAAQYTKTGAKTPTHIYRNINRNWELTEGVDLTVHQPVLMLTAELDMMLPPESASQMPDLCPDLEIKLLEDSGHWAMWEKSTAINTHITDWLGRRLLWKSDDRQSTTQCAHR